MNTAPGTVDVVVFLCRHGQTPLNAENRLRGLSDPPLTDVGQAEASALATELADRRPTVVVSSPMRRAIATAQAIAAAAHVRVVADQRLLDRDYGAQSGRLESAVIEEFGSIDSAPGVESMDHLIERARVGFQQLVDEFGPGPLVLVAHDAINRALLADLDPTLTGLAQPTGCWNKLVHSDGAWHVELYDQKPSAS